ncbi:MAG: hypothetical protein JWP75_1425 [Frondihabitans sp.]|nr:hypothetical protein [Frondihabitans sp.]
MGRLTGTLRATPSAVFGSTAARLAEMERADHAIRILLALSHRIAFVQLAGGSGTSAVAAYIAGLLAHRRTGPILGVNASGGDRTLLWYAGVRGDASETTDDSSAEDDGRRLRPAHFADASAGLLRAASGLYLFDVRRSTIGIAATETDWATPVAPITRFYDVVCTDWGVRRPELDLGGVAAGSHAVCLVARADRSSLEEAVAAATALTALPSAPHVVVAAVDIGNTAGRAPQVVRWDAGTRILRIPYDAARSAAEPVASSSLSTRSRLAHTMLAAELMTQADRTGTLRSTAERARA